MRLAVRVTPRGGRDAIEGWREDAAGRPVLKVRLAAPAAEGAANAALVELLAKALGVAKSAVRLVSGQTSRMKLLEVEGLEALPEALRPPPGRPPASSR
jgi:uncharacterized protein